MFTYHIKYWSSIFSISLSLTLSFVLNESSAQISKPTEKASTKDTLPFPCIGFRSDTLYSVKRSIWNEEAIFSVSDVKSKEWKILAPPQSGLYGLQIQTTPMTDIFVDSTFGVAIAD